MNILLARQPFCGLYGALMGPALTIPIRDKPPMNLLYLAAQIQREGKHTVEVYDAATYRVDLDEAAREIARRSPDLLGLIAYLPILPEAKVLAAKVKQLLPGVKIVVGGPMVDFYPKEILEWNEIDMIMFGDAESYFTRFVNALDSGDDLSTVPNLGYKQDGRSILNESGSLCTDLDSLPFPDRTLVPYKRYHTFMCEALYSTVLLTSRGCPFSCRFCPNPKRRGGKLHYRSASNIVDEIETILELGIGKIFIYDDTFCFSRSQVLDFCDEVIRRKLPKFTFSAKARVKQIDAEVLGRLRQAGCTQLGFGLESGSNATLKRMNKDITTADSIRALRLCKESGIISHGYFVMGFPGETLDEAVKTVDFAINSPLDFAQFYSCTTMPGSPIYYEALEKGIFHDYWADYCRDPIANRDFPNWNDPITAEEQNALVKTAHNRFYLSPKKWVRMAKIFSAPYRRRRVFGIAWDFLTQRVHKYSTR